MHIIDNPPIPFSTPIFRGFPEHGKIKIHGEPYCGYSKGFVVELFAGNEIALHLNARFGACGEHKLVVNSNRYGRWEEEDRHHNPFKINHHFHLKIKNHGSHFSIHVNNHHVCHFHHRIDPCRITGLGIKGDVNAFKIHFEEFSHHNEGGVQVGGFPEPPPPYMSGIGGGVAPTPIYPPTGVGSGVSPSGYAGGIGSGTIPYSSGIGGGATPIRPVGVQPPPPVGIQPPPPVVVGQPAPVVVIEEERRHHHHHHGFLHDLFHHH
uniref:Galectin n=1 Tax=Strongyloides stercoralis TaxID=6248 RepID=A0A0K0EL90_STRER